MGVLNRRIAFNLEGVSKAIALAVFVAMLLIVGSRHEPWFDEAQAWLIARDNSLWSLLARGVRYEGTPGLWHSLLWAVERLGLPYRGFWLVSATLATAGAWIVLDKAPFPIWMRVGLIFSYFFAYQFSVVARSYALDLLLLPLLAWLFKDRLARPLVYAGLLGLLANANAHSFVLSAVLALELLWSARIRLLSRDWVTAAAIALYAILALAAVIQAAPPKDINFITHRPDDFLIGRLLVILTEGLIERWDVFSFASPSGMSRIVGAILSILVLAMVWPLWRKANRMTLSVSLIGGLLLFSTVQYASYWHSGLVFLTFVFCLWISWSELPQLSIPVRRRLVGGVGLVIAVQVWSAVAAETRDVMRVYSPARAVADALKAGLRAHPGQTIGVAGFKAFAVQPYFEANRFANYDGGAPHPAYYAWRKSQTLIPGLDEAQWRQTAAAGYDRLVLSTFNAMGANGPTRYLQDARAAGYCETARFPGEMIWKTYAKESDEMRIFDRCDRRSS